MIETANSAPFEVVLLGGFFVRSATGRVIEFSGQKDRALLAYLALSPDVPHYRDKLASLLWSDRGDKQARDSLKQALLRLRRTFGEYSATLLTANRQSVTLSGDEVTVDVGRFERLVQEGTPAALEQAVQLYRGDLHDGLHVRDSAFEDWLLVERQRLRDLAIEAATDLMSRSLANGQRDRATTAARRLASLDPLHEGACRTLMQAHANRGERAQALKLFEILRDRLQQDLGVAPESYTVTLYQSVRRQRAGADRSPTPCGAELQNGLASTALAVVPSIEGPREGEPAAVPSIAVLPFANIGDDPEQDYFADGLTEDIVTDLSRISALSVAARHAVWAFKARSVPLHEIASALGVRYLLEGTVRNAEGRVRITAQLVDAHSGRHVWANRFDRSLDNIFALQNEIAESIVDVLRVKLLPQELECMTSHSTKNVDAYQYYLMGRSFYLRGMHGHHLRIARDLFAKAIEIDPCYARAYAGIALCDSYLSLNDPSLTLRSCLANCSRALALDPSLAEAYAVEGLALYTVGRFAEATAKFERAIDLDPQLFEAHFFHARNCRLQKRHAESAVLLERAVELRPNDFRSSGLLADAYRFLGRAEDFRAAARRCLERIESEIDVHPDNADALAFGSALFAELDEPARAEDWAGRALIIGPDDSVVRYNVCRTYVSLRRHEDALDLLEQAFCCPPILKRRLWAWMQQDQDIDPLRRQPRFVALARRLKGDADLCS